MWYIAKIALMDLVAGAEVFYEIVIDRKADLATTICTPAGF
ncbi:MAG: hypothetical protein ACKVG6_03815 [Alphaproteobacteria bacterium]